jgi:hypothetical protein
MRISEDKIHLATAAIGTQRLTRVETRMAPREDDPRSVPLRGRWQSSFTPLVVNHLFFISILSLTLVLCRLPSSSTSHSEDKCLLIISNIHTDELSFLVAS